MDSDLTLIIILCYIEAVAIFLLVIDDQAKETVCVENVKHPHKAYYKDLSYKKDISVSIDTILTDIPVKCDFVLNCNHLFTFFSISCLFILFILLNNFYPSDNFFLKKIGLQENPRKTFLKTKIC